MKPRYNAHCEFHPDCESRPSDSAELAGSTLQFMRELRPREVPFAALRIERVIKFLKIPTKPLIGTGERKRRPHCVSRRAGHETLWRSAKPAKHEERVLAGGITAFRHASERRRANWVIAALRVQRRRLIPQLLGNTLPT